MRTLFGHLKKKKSGQAVKAHTVRQKWTMSNFQFLSGHLCIRIAHSQLGRVPLPSLQVELEGEDEGGDDDDVASVTYNQVPSQLSSTSQAGPVKHHSHDRRPRAASSTGSSTGKRVDEAILKLVDWLSQNTGMQDRLQSAVKKSAKPNIAFCQWMGLEMSKLDEELWTGFMYEAFDLVMRYRQFQTQQPAPLPPPPTQAVLPPSVQPQPYQPSVRPWSMPPLSSPPFRQQLNPSWQPGPSTKFQHQGWPSFTPQPVGPQH